MSFSHDWVNWDFQESRKIAHQVRVQNDASHSEIARELFDVDGNYSSGRQQVHYLWRYSRAVLWFGQHFWSQWNAKRVQSICKVLFKHALLFPGVTDFRSSKVKFNVFSCSMATLLIADRSVRRQFSLCSASRCFTPIISGCLVAITKVTRNTIFSNIFIKY